MSTVTTGFGLPFIPATYGQPRTLNVFSYAGSGGAVCGGASTYSFHSAGGSGTIKILVPFVAGWYGYFLSSSSIAFNYVGSGGAVVAGSATCVFKSRGTTGTGDPGPRYGHDWRNNPRNPHHQLPADHWANPFSHVNTMNKPAVPVKPVESSMVTAVGHDATTNTLAVKFKSGREYHYHDVPKEKHDKIVKAKSAGKAIHRHVLEKHNHTRQN